MTNREIVMEYLRCFCGGDVAGLEALLAANLRFTGTFYSYNSAAEYLDSLKADPPEECGCRLLSITESENSVAVFYDYEKSNGAMKIAQLFKVEGERIQEVLLIFDGRGIA